MDPAQLEADIAALTSAIAADAAALEASPQGMSSYPGHIAARHAAYPAAGRPTYEHDLRSTSESYGLSGCATPVKGTGAQNPHVLNQHQVHSRTVQGFGLPMATGSRGVPDDAERQGVDQEQPSGLQHR